MKPNHVLYGALLLATACGKKMEEATPIRKDVTETVFASGELEADGTYSLTAQTSGYLVQVNFSEGDLVKAGTVLALIDNKENLFNTESAQALYKIAESNMATSAPALAQARNAIRTAAEILRNDSVNYKRYALLAKSNSVSQVEAENALLKYRTAQASYQSSIEAYNLQEQQARQALINQKAQKEVSGTSLGNNRIRAVVGGKVYKKHKQRGDYVRAGDVIAELGDARLIYAKVSVDESNIRKIAVGQQAVVQLNTDKSKKYNATVHEIYPAFDEATQSFYCKLFFTDTLGFTITGTQLQSNIVTGFQKNAMLIPRNFLGFDGTVQVKGEAAPRKVNVLFVGTDWVQVIQGLHDTDVLVTDNIVGNKTNPSEIGSQMR